MPRVILISIDGFAAFYWSDPRVKIPTLRALAERGAVARGMEAVFPSTTWPTHVSLVTGVRPRAHGVVANSILNRATGQREDLTGDPIYDAPDLLRAPTIYDRAYAAGLRCAAIDWPATRGAASLDFNLPFFKDQKIFEAHTPRATWSELKTLGYPVERQGEWAQQPKRFLSTDSFQHLYGPGSPEALWVIEYVDGLIGQFLATLPSDELDARTALFVVSDHGFFPVEQEVRINVRLRQLGLLDQARFVTNHGAGYLYLSDRRDAQAIVRDLVPELRKIEGVSGVWTGADYPGLGLPTPEENPHAGDLLLEAAPGYDFADEAQGDEVITSPPRYRGTHGQLPIHPENAAFFLALGPGIRRGMELARISSRDVAPTVAHALGVRMGETEGRLLTEILR